ncbi:MAG: hypothetical protein IKH82_06000 [Clostridiales bacterium]|nr:hypothetical protein [Clostridiales bacterium]MBR6987604.1 hypothetical protein [Clostridiales bacterium]
MKKCINSLKSLIKGTARKALAVVMCAAFITGMAFSFTGCKLIDFFSSGLNVSLNSLSETELARLMTNAILSERNVADCYNKLPSSQLNGLSYSMFSEYCSILRKCSQEHGTADSFRILNETEKNQYFALIDGSDNEFRSVDVYGDMDVIELSYSQDKNPEASPVRFTIAKNGDKYAMAGQYITDSMLAYSYINHYFDMIDDGNIDGLEAIIKSTYDSDIYMNSVIYAKANYIADYYMLKVKSNAEEYQLKLFSPTHITYVIPEVFNGDGDSIFSKTVELRLQNDGSFFVQDDIPVVINELRFFGDGESKLRMGSSYTKEEIIALLGEPVIVSYDEGIVILTYSGMTIRLDADLDKDNNWTSGRLSSVVLRKDDRFTIGEELFIGMNISELLLIYPMFDECDFTASFQNGDGEFVLSFQFDDFGNVTRIRLGEAVG